MESQILSNTPMRGAAIAPRKPYDLPINFREKFSANTGDIWRVRQTKK